MDRPLLIHFSPWHPTVGVCLLSLDPYDVEYCLGSSLAINDLPSSEGELSGSV